MVNNPNNIIKMNNPISPQIIKNIKTDHSTWRWKSWWWRFTIYISYITTAREKINSSTNLAVIIGSVAGSALAFIVIGIVSIYIWRRQLV
jgi:hypothetical protein